jgi:hypothetical protein
VTTAQSRRGWSAILALILTLAALAEPGPGALAADCELKLGFKALADQVPDVVGACLENERFNTANGNSEQRTTAHHGKGGLLVWRKADNWTAFTDGYWTWVNGPFGVARRLNTETFDWEAPAPPAAPPAASAAPTAVAPVPLAPTGPLQTAPPRLTPTAAAAGPAPTTCSVLLPGRDFAAVFQSPGTVRPACETWARALTDRLRATRSEADWCARVRVPKGMTDDTCRFLRSLGTAEPAVVDQTAGRGLLVCTGETNGVRFAVLDSDQQQIGGLFCTVLEDSSVKTLRA